MLCSIDEKTPDLDLCFKASNNCRYKKVKVVLTRLCYVHYRNPVESIYLSSNLATECRQYVGSTAKQTPPERRSPRNTGKHSDYHERTATQTPPRERRSPRNTGKHRGYHGRTATQTSPERSVEKPQESQGSTPKQRVP